MCGSVVSRRRRGEQRVARVRSTATARLHGRQRRCGSATLTRRPSALSRWPMPNAQRSDGLCQPPSRKPTRLGSDRPVRATRSAWGTSLPSRAPAARTSTCKRKAWLGVQREALDRGHRAPRLAAADGVARQHAGQQEVLTQVLDLAAVARVAYQVHATARQSVDATRALPAPPTPPTPQACGQRRARCGCPSADPGTRHRRAGPRCIRRGRRDLARPRWRSRRRPGHGSGCCMGAHVRARRGRVFISRALGAACAPAAGPTRPSARGRHRPGAADPAMLVRLTPGCAGRAGQGGRQASDSGLVKAQQETFPPRLSSGSVPPSDLQARPRTEPARHAGT